MSWSCTNIDRMPNAFRSFLILKDLTLRISTSPANLNRKRDTR